VYIPVVTHLLKNDKMRNKGKTYLMISEIISSVGSGYEVLIVGNKKFFMYMLPDGMELVPVYKSDAYGNRMEIGHTIVINKRKRNHGKKKSFRYPGKQKETVVSHR
jgi:hypothetical protein